MSSSDVVANATLVGILTFLVPWVSLGGFIVGTRIIKRARPKLSAPVCILLFFGPIILFGLGCWIEGDSAVWIRWAIGAALTTIVLFLASAVANPKGHPRTANFLRALTRR